MVNNTSIYNNVVGEQSFFSKSKTSYVEHDYILKNEVPILEIGRGCIFNCKFCSFALKSKERNESISLHECCSRHYHKNHLHGKQYPV